MTSHPRRIGSQKPGASALLNDAIAHHKAGRLQKAQDLYRAVLKAEPSHPHANHNLGRLLAQAGHPDMAVTYLRTALKADQTHAQFWRSLVETLLQAGRLGEAAAALAAPAAQRSLGNAACQDLGNRLERQRAASPDLSAYRALEEGHRHGELSERVRQDMARFGRQPVLLWWLGKAMLHLGQTQAALACLEEAQPHFHRDINLLNQIAIALQRLERFDEAADWYEKALAIMPNHAEITSNLGNARMRAGQYEQALALFERAHAKGGHVVARVNQALALHHLGRGEQADGIVEEVRARRPLQVPVLNAIAHFHRMRRRPEQAVQVLRQVLALDPASCHALAHLATVALDFGRFAEAETMYRRALHMHPQLTEALAQIPKMRKMTPADDWWLRGVEPILAGSLPSREEADLRYALAKYYDDIGDYPAAYDQGVRANALQKNRQKPYDPAAYERRVGRTIEITGAEEIGRALSGANQSDRPVLIVGMPRSGTSLAEQIVASHPDAYGAGELSYWGESLRGLVPDSRMEDLPDGPIQTLADSYLAHLNEFDSRAKRVTDKMPGNFFLAGFIHRIFPNARIIHMRRDPRDVCLSIFFQSFNDRHEYATDLNDLAHYYRQYLRITAHWRAVLPSDRFMEVRYEDLIADQETWTRRILDFIGLPWDDRCLRFHETDRKVGTASNWQVRQKIYKSSAARWKRYEQFLGPLADLAREEGLED